MKLKYPIIILLCIGISIFVYLLFFNNQDSVEYLSEFKGRDEIQVISKLGNPNDRIFYLTNDTTTNIRLPLRGDYIPTDSLNPNVTLLTMWWNKADITTLIWFRKINDKWIAVGEKRWNNKEVIF